MSQADLKNFLEQRLVDLSPSLSTVGGAPIHTKVITPLLRRLSVDPLSTDIASFITDRVQEEFPEIDTSSISNFSDLFIKPLRMLLEPFKLELEFIKTQQSFDNADALSDEELDSLLANQFYNRSLGDYSRVNVVLNYSAPQSVFLDASIVFSTAEGVQFVPETPIQLGPADFVKSGALYSVTVAVRSVIPHVGANVDPEAIRFVTGLPNVVRVVNIKASRGGITRENNREALVNAQNSLTERSPTTHRGIARSIKDSFSEAMSIETVGFGDAEMGRDILEVQATVTGSIPGEVVYVGNPTIVPFSGDSYTVGIPVSNTLRFASIDLTSTIAGGQFLTLVYASPGDGTFVDNMFTKIRTVLSATFDGTNTDVTLTDFEYIAGGGSSQLQTFLHDNVHTRQGGDKVIKPSLSDHWRGAPLHFTDSLVTSEDLSAITALPGRDFIITQNSINVKQLLVFPVRKVLTVDGGGSVILINRSDSFLTDARRSPSVHSWNEGDLMGKQGIEVRAFGAPDFDEATPVYNGSTPVAGGTLPGAAMVSNGVGVGSSLIKLLPDAENWPEGWLSLGAKVGDCLSVALFAEGSGTGAAPIWMSHGRISDISDGTPENCTVDGIDETELHAQNVLLFDDSTSLAFPAASPYRLAWTLYSGENLVVTPADTQVTSYEDFVWAPCYDPDNITIGSDDVHVYGINTTTDYTTRNTRFNNTSPDTRPTNYFYLRLPDKFNELTLSPSTTTLLAEYLDSPLIIDTSGTTYAKHRYPNKITDSNNSNNSSVVSPAILPVSIGQNWDTITWPGTFTGLNASSDNTRAVSGNILPESTTKVLTAVVQAATELKELVDTGEVTISGVPGGFPFTNTLSNPLTVNSGELHIGGSVDVYCKEQEVESLSTTFRLTSSAALGDSGKLFEATDGETLSPSRWRVSSSALDTAYTVVTGQDLVGTTLVVNNSTETPDIIGDVHSVIDCRDVLGVLTLGVYPPIDTPAPVTDISFSLYTSTRTVITDPEIVLRSGTDSYLPLLSNLFTTTGVGFTFVEDPTVTPIYLRIDSGESAGEYRVVTKTATTLVLDGLLHGPEFGASYSVYIQQNSVRTPLVRVRSMETSGDINVPIAYSEPVLAEVGNFASPNNSPLDLTGATITPSGTLHDLSKNFSTLGVRKYDVVKVEGMDVDNTYFYVTALDITSNTDDTLVLDRAFTNITTDASGTAYAVGPPAVGKARVYFLDRTYYSVDGAASFVSDALSFRPSLQEEAVMFEQEFTSNTVNVTASTGVVLTTVTDWNKLGIQVGDEVTFPRKVWVGGSTLTSSEAANLAVVGTTLYLSVDGTSTSVTFTGTGTLTFDEVVKQLNEKYGGVLVASNSANGAARELQIYSSSDIRAIAAFATLGIGGAETNVSLNTAPCVVTDVYRISDLYYAIVVDTAPLVADEDVFIKVTRRGTQRVMPADMIETSAGLFYFDVTLTSNDPWSYQYVKDGTPVVSTGHTSYGYSLYPLNEVLSYSDAEKVVALTTSHVLPATATSLLESVPVYNKEVNVEYDRSPLTSDVQQFLSLPRSRALAGNFLARHFLPAYILIDVAYRGNVQQSDVVDSVAKFVSSLYPNRPLYTYTLFQELNRLGLTYVRNEEFAYVTHAADRSISVERSDDSITLTRLQHIMEDSSGITAVKVG